jgi:hypothetical protein
MGYKLKDITNFIGVTRPKQPETEQPSPQPSEPVGEKHTLLSWESHARESKKKVNHKFQKTLVAIGVVVALLLAIMGEFFLILVIASLVFISHVLSSTPPELVKYEVSNHGLDVADQFYPWNTLKQFFFSTATTPGTEVLAVDTVEKFPGRLFLHFAPDQRDRLHEIFSKHLPFVKEEPVSAMDKAYLSFLGKFNTHSDEE